MQLANTYGLVLGASRAIGRAIARDLAARGVRLFLPWYDWPEDVAEMKKEFPDDQGHLCLQADLRQRDDVARLAREIDSRAGRLDILINNIERGGMPIVHGAYSREVNQDQWQREMDTTLHAKWLVFDQCLPLLRQAREAAVINISSIAACTGRAGIAGLLFNDGYAAANRGVAALTEIWARMGAPTIRVNELMLGIIDGRHGPGTRGWQALSEAEQAMVIDHTLLRRTGTPEEVSRMVLCLLEQADFMTGTTIRLDGGFVLGGEPVPAMPPGII